MLNVHPSLLPRWRGAAPIERAIMAGDERTGVTIMRLTEGLDSGPIGLQEEVAAGPGEDFGDLEPRLAELGGELLVRAFDLRAAGELDLAEQDDSQATYAEKIAGADRRLDPARPATELARPVRALTPHIGALLRARRRAIGSACAGAEAAQGDLEPGTLRRRRRRARAGHRRGDLLNLLESFSRPAASRCPRATTCAATPRPPARSLIATPARRAAFEVLRRVFEDGAWADRALPAAIRRAAASPSASGAWPSGSPTGRCSGAAAPTS